MWSDFFKNLGAEVDGASLAVVRWVTAGAMLVVSLSVLLSGRTADIFMRPGIRFHYPLAKFVIPLPGSLPYALLAVIAAASLAVILGWRTRVATLVLCAATVYWFLLDRLTYSDKYYLITLMTILMAVVPVNRWLSADRRLGRETQSTIFGWQLWLIRVQLILVYFFSAVGMLQSDWLAGAPLTERLATSPMTAALGDRAGVALAWGAIVFNVSIGPLLMWRRTRLAALLLMTMYHAADYFWLKIGVAPLFLWAYSLVFCDPQWPRRVFDRVFPVLIKLPLVSLAGSLLCRLGMLVESALGWFDDSPAFKKRSPARKSAAPLSGKKQKPIQSSPLSELGKYCLTAWLLIQVFLPLRAFAYHGNPRWTDNGRLFAWWGDTVDQQGELTLSLIQTDQQLLWPLTPTNEFPLPLSIAFSRNELKGRGLNDGTLRDLMLTSDKDLLERRIAGAGLEEEDVARLNEAYRLITRLRLAEFQFQEMSKHPELIRQYCVFAAETLQPILRRRPKVQADLQLSLNHRPWTTLIAADNDLSQERFSLDSYQWTLSLNEDLPSLQQRIAWRREHVTSKFAGTVESAPAGDQPKPREPVLAPGISDSEEQAVRARFRNIEDASSR